MVVPWRNKVSTTRPSHPPRCGGFLLDDGKSIKMPQDRSQGKDSVDSQLIDLDASNAVLGLL